MVREAPRRTDILFEFALAAGHVAKCANARPTRVCHVGQGRSFALRQKTDW